MPGQLQTKDIGDVKCLLRTIVIPSHALKKNSERKNKNGMPFHDRERITNFQKYHKNNSNIPN